MTYINPRIRCQFETIPIELKDEILARDVKLNNLGDLMSVLEEIISESEN